MEFYSRLRRSLLGASLRYWSSNSTAFRNRSLGVASAVVRTYCEHRSPGVALRVFRTSVSPARMNDLDIDLAKNTPWVDMSACVKFGLDRPSRLAGHTEHRYVQTNRQTNVSPFCARQHIC